MIQVKEGSRILQFNGRLIGSSSSWRRGSQRWVEFKLYKTTDSGTYVLSRVGVSTLYHHPECLVVSRNRLHEEPRDILKPDSTPCPDCRPDQTDFPLVCPERNRYWAQVCETPQAVIESLMKYDDSGSRYLTFVAQRLLEDASEEDQELSDTYRVETIT